jgi:hypothetical protein
LSYRGHGLEFRSWIVGKEEGLDLFVEGGLAGIVEAEEEDRVFCQLSGHGWASGGRGIDLLCLLRTGIGLWLGDTSSTPEGRRGG